MARRRILKLYIIMMVNIACCFADRSWIEIAEFEGDSWLKDKIESKDSGLAFDIQSNQEEKPWVVVGGRAFEIANCTLLPLEDYTIRTAEYPISPVAIELIDSTESARSNFVKSWTFLYERLDDERTVNFQETCFVLYQQHSLASLDSTHSSEKFLREEFFDLYNSEKARYLDNCIIETRKTKDFVVSLSQAGSIEPQYEVWLNVESAPILINRAWMGDQEFLWFDTFYSARISKRGNLCCIGQSCKMIVFQSGKSLILFDTSSGSFAELSIPLSGAVNTIIHNDEIWALGQTANCESWRLKLLKLSD